MLELDSQPSITSLRDSSSIICRQGGSLDIAGSLNIAVFLEFFGQPHSRMDYLYRTAPLRPRNNVNAAAMAQRIDIGQVLGWRRGLPNANLQAKSTIQHSHS